MGASTVISDKLLEKIKKNTQPLLEFSFVKGILLYGSLIQGSSSPRSDIDIAIVAPTIPHKTRFSYEVLKMLPSPPYDVKHFESLPLYLQIEILDHHYLLHTHSSLDLYEYLYYYYKLWNDQAHRQHLTRQELREMLS